jgi:hypothetical protein
MTLLAPPPRTAARPTVRPMDRALMLMALGLDPGLSYSDRELHCAWRRRISEVHPDHGGNAVAAAAVSASYVALVSRVEMPRSVDFRI